MGDLGKLIVAKAFKKLPKVQKIAKSGHTATYYHPNAAAAKTISVKKNYDFLTETKKEIFTEDFAGLRLTWSYVEKCLLLDIR